MGFISTLSKALSIASETSSAVSSAKEVLNSGGSIAQAVEAFVGETDTPVDDAVFESLVEYSVKLAEWSKNAGVYAIKASGRIDANMQQYISKGRTLLDQAEELQPEIRKGLQHFAKAASRLSNKANDVLGR